MSQQGLSDQPKSERATGSACPNAFCFCRADSLDSQKEVAASFVPLVASRQERAIGDIVLEGQLWGEPNYYMMGRCTLGWN
jgi:hypothetical protein